jgi:hypothetical protein
MRHAAWSVEVSWVRPQVWRPPVEPSRLEQAVMARTRRAKLFVWLRQHRHVLLEEGFQAELAGMYADQKVGQPPTPPALLGLVTILQAYTGASDAEAVEASVMDRRWQLVLDCMDQARAPFSKATLVASRGRLIAAELDRRLVERTVALYAEAMGVPAARQVRVALDSSPLWGAGLVEDTINLVGHALRKVLGVLVRQQGWGLAWGLPVMAEQAGVGELAALDLERDDPTTRDLALGMVLGAAERLEGWVATQPGGNDPQVASHLATAHQIQAQDVEAGPDGAPTLRQGVARDRRISIEDAQMRHGRKTRSVRVDGYKRHVVRDLDAGLVRAVGVTPANLPEARVADQIQTALAHQDAHLAELHIDRAYLASSLVADRDPDLAIYCKAFPVRNGPRLPRPRSPWTSPRAAHLPQPGQDAVHPWRQGPVSCSDLPGLPTARPVHHQHPWAQRADPPRRATAGRTPRPAAHPPGPGQVARARPGRAQPGPHRRLAGPPRPLPGNPQEPVRPAPLRHRAQPARHCLPSPTSHPNPTSSLNRIPDRCSR